MEGYPDRSSGYVFGDGGCLCGKRNGSGELLYENIRIFLDGDELVPRDANGMTVEPFIIDGTTYVPICAISEAYDKKVSWNDEKKRNPHKQ